MDIGKNMHGHPAPRPPKEQIFSPFTLHWSWLKQKILLASSKQQLWFKAICSKHIICYTYQLKECLITRWNVTTFSSVFIHRCSIWKCPKHALQPRPKKGSVEVTDTRVGQLVLGSLNSSQLHRITSRWNQQGYHLNAWQFWKSSNYTTDPGISTGSQRSTTTWKSRGKAHKSRWVPHLRLTQSSFPSLSLSFFKPLNPKQHHQIMPKSDVTR